MRPIPTRLLLLCLTLAGLFLIAPFPAHAQWSLFGDLAYTVVGKAVFGIAWVVSFIAGAVIAMESWALQIVLDINTKIVDSGVVRYGFPVALSLANLAFIIGVIVIAIMTIIRQQSYGLKQTLWKLVVMAVLVNFGLVICKGILNFFDQITLFFVQAITPAGAGVNGYMEFASAIAGAFNPQRGFMSMNDLQPGTDVSGLAAMGASIGTMLAPITSLLFTGFMLIMIALTLAALIVMLVIRYVYLGYLLVLLPLAWASWVFPITQSNWQKWWSTFLKQAYFPVGVIFFLYLTILAAGEMSQGSLIPVGGVSEGDGSAWGGIVALLGAVFAPIISIGLQQAVVIGLAMGGLFFAQNTGIKFAGAATKLANSTVSGFGNWAGSVAQRGATRPIRGATGRKLVEGMQNLGANQTGARAPLRWLARPIREAGQKLSQVREPVEKMVADAGKDLSKLSIEERGRRFGSANVPERLAILQNLEAAAKKTKKQKVKVRKTREVDTGMLDAAGKAVMRQEEYEEEEMQSVPTEVAAAAKAALAQIDRGMGGEDARKNTIERWKVLYGKGGEYETQIRKKKVSWKETFEEKSKTEELIEAVKKEGEEEAKAEKGGDKPAPAPAPAPSSTKP